MHNAAKWEISRNNRIEFIREATVQRRKSREAASVKKKQLALSGFISLLSDKKQPAVTAKMISAKEAGTMREYFNFNVKDKMADREMSTSVWRWLSTSKNPKTKLKARFMAERDESELKTIQRDVLMLGGINHV